MMLKQKVLDAYSDGSPIGLIVESFNITYEQVLEMLHSYRDSSRMKKSYTEDFKMMIAQRDSSGGVTRSSIALELGINANTVKKSCEKYGNSVKEQAISEQLYTRIDGEYSLNSCPSCNSHKVNLVEDNTTYCKSCGSEHIHKQDHVLKLNFEYLEK